VVKLIFQNTIVFASWRYIIHPFVGLAYQGKDIVFRFIIEYSSLRDFWPLGNNRLIFYMKIFER
jgi:hypothetical protein